VPAHVFDARVSDPGAGRVKLDHAAYGPRPRRAAMMCQCQVNARAGHLLLADRIGLIDRTLTNERSRGNRQPRRNFKHVLVLDFDVDRTALLIVLPLRTSTSTGRPPARQPPRLGLHLIRARSSFLDSGVWTRRETLPSAAAAVCARRPVLSHV
jgi:hypothetical protein